MFPKYGKTPKWATFSSSLLFYNYKSERNVETQWKSDDKSISKLSRDPGEAANIQSPFIILDHVNWKAGDAKLSLECTRQL